MRRFTLVEMMIVIAIVLLLAAIAIPLLAQYQQRAREAELLTNVDGLRKAEAAYVAESGYTLFPTPAANPAGIPGKTAQPWIRFGTWDALGYMPDGDLRGSYTIMAGDWRPWVVRGCADTDVDNLCSVCEGTEVEAGCADGEVPLLTGCGCFVAGTAVRLASGRSVPIEDLRVGDLVLAYDADGTLGAYPVTGTWGFPPRPLVELVLADGTRVVGTAPHPFFSGAIGPGTNDDPAAWTNLGDLGRGDLVARLHQGDLEEVEVVSVRNLADTAPVFNLTVEGAHTFFVQDVLVHNKNAGACLYDGTSWSLAGLSL